MADNWSDGPDPSLARTDLLAWGTVRSSLALSFFGGLFFFLSVLVLAVVFMTHEPEVRKIPMLILVITTLSLLGVLAGLVLGFTGTCMTTAAPAESGARAWGLLSAVATTVFLVLAVVLALTAVDAHARTNVRERNIIMLRPFNWPHEQPPFSPAETRIMLYVWGGSLLVAIVTYLLWLRAVAAAFHRTGVALAVLCYLIFLLLFLGGATVVVLNQFQLNRVGPVDLDQLRNTARMVLGGLVLLGIWGLVTTALVRGCVTRGMLHGE